MSKLTAIDVIMRTTGRGYIAAKQVIEKIGPVADELVELYEKGGKVRELISGSLSKHADAKAERINIERNTESVKKAAVKRNARPDKVE